MKKERSPAIELYRCLVMFGIVFIHSAYFTIGSHTWEKAIGQWCVDGFVMISGYCGIRAFSIGKVAKLYATAAFLLVFTCLVPYCIGVNVDNLTGGGVIAELCKLSGAWFIHAYVLMMAIAPLINVAAERRECHRHLVAFCALVFLWGTACELPVLNKVMWRTAGVGSFSGLTLAAVYAVGRLYKVRGWENRLKPIWAAAALPFLLLLACAGMRNGRGDWTQGWLGGYASPVSVAIAVAVFHLFLRIGISGFAKRCVLWVSASMFPVYIVHCQPVLLDWARRTAWLWMDFVPVPIALFAVSAIWFALSVVCDVPRRMLVFSINRVRMFLVARRV